MDLKSEATDLKRYLPHVLFVTFAVTALPLLAVFAIERTFGLMSPFAAGALGVAFSLVLAVAGSTAWRKFGKSDLVFSDLLIWGYLRRLWVDRRLAKMTKELRQQEGAAIAGEMSSRDRAKLLADLASLMESADPYTHGHSRRVTRHSYMIARTMGLPKELVDKIRIAAAVHDVGKIHTPKQILNKPDRLTDEEFAVIKEHPGKGAEMVAILGDDEITKMVRHHHERLDGKGYPDQLAREDIPIGARVIAVADTFDAITSSRAYRSASRHKKAIDILKNESGKQLDGAAVLAFMRYYSGRSSVGWWASLTTVPQRLVASLVNWFQQTAVGAVVQTAAAVGTSVALVTTIPVAPLVSQGVAAGELGSVGFSQSGVGGGSFDSSGAPSADSQEPKRSGSSPSSSDPRPSPSPTSGEGDKEPQPDSSTSPTTDPTTSPSSSPSPSGSPSPSSSPSPTSSPLDPVTSLVDDVLDLLL